MKGEEFKDKNHLMDRTTYAVRDSFSGNHYVGKLAVAIQESAIPKALRVSRLCMLVRIGVSSLLPLTTRKKP